MYCNGLEKLHINQSQSRYSPKRKPEAQLKMPGRTSVNTQTKNDLIPSLEGRILEKRNALAHRKKAKPNRGSVVFQQSRYSFHLKFLIVVFL